MWRVDADGVFRYHDPFEEELLALEYPSQCWNFSDPDPYDPMGVQQAVIRYYPEAHLGGMLIGAALSLLGMAAASLITSGFFIADLIKDYRKKREGI